MIEIDAQVLRSLPLPRIAESADKVVRGRVVVIGGGASAPGAVVLSGLAALRAGAGKLQLGVPHSLMCHIGAQFWEAGIAGYSQTADGEPAAAAAADMRVIAEQADTVLIGPGLMDDQAAHELATGLLREVVGPLYVIDAIALCGLGGSADLLAKHNGRIVLTPHAGEMSRLTGIARNEVEAKAANVAAETAQRLHCVVVLKGPATYISTVEGKVFRNKGDLPGLGTAGSGDVLAGMVAGFVARGASPLAASVWGVSVHARAGVRLAKRIGPLGFLAREIIDEIPSLVASV